MSDCTYSDLYPEPGDGSPKSGLQEAIAFRVIADHIRTLSFSIADGILPGNTGRNYVLRRILRRAVRYGRALGFSGNKPFLADLVDTVVSEMGAVFPELNERASVIRETLQREESSFNETLDRGLKLFEDEVLRISGSVFSGDAAFKLYDTFGFPIDLTQLLCRERDLEVAMARFEELMEKQRQSARDAQKSEIVSALDIATEAITEFVGFEQDECEATVLEEHTQEDLQWVITDQTPFYAEMGGQVGDTGTLVVDGREIPVVGVQQIGGARAHGVPEDLAGDLVPGDKVTLKLNTGRRRPIEAHHTATHLLHWALHKVVSPDATQQGSLVAEDRLRFDFTSASVSKEQIAQLEIEVNACVEAAQPVSWKEVPFPDVKGRDDIMQFFGDKYGKDVRVVQIGGEPQALDGYSMELCGGTHVRSTSEIGLFKIRKEEAIAAGTRRIEAVCGAAAEAFLAELAAKEGEEMEAALAKLQTANEALAALATDGFTAPDGATAAEVKAIAVEAEKALKKARTAKAARQADQFLAAAVENGATSANLVETLEGPAALLQELLNGLKRVQFTHAAFLVVDDGENLHLGALCGEDAHNAGLGAGNLIKDLAPLVGGKGGGKPDMARGAGSARDKKEALLEAARAAL